MLNPGFKPYPWFRCVRMKLQKRIEKILLLQEMFKVYVENRVLQLMTDSTDNTAPHREKKARFQPFFCLKQIADESGPLGEKLRSDLMGVASGGRWTETVFQLRGQLAVING